MPSIIIGIIFECGQGAARCGCLSGKVRLFFRAVAVFVAAYTMFTMFIGEMLHLRASVISSMCFSVM